MFRGSFSKRTAILIGVLVAFTLIVALSALILLVTFGKLVETMIGRSIAITPSSAVYKNWASTDAPIFFSIYLYNITNSEDILLGQKPRLQQIGPYVYREKREKTNITWPNGDYSRVSFFQRLSFTLDRDLSVGNPDTDLVRGISTPFVTIAANMEAGNGPSPIEYSFFEWFVTPKLFVTETVTNFLWGYDDPLIKGCNLITPDKCPSPKVGIMLDKNGTHSGPFVIETGADDISRVGNILSYKGNETVDVWSSPEANQIKGTDGSHAAPNLDLNSTRFIFATDLCRSFELRVIGPGKLTNSDKLQVFLLGGTPETAQNASVNPENLGFCPPKTPGPKCPPTGLFDLSACKRQGTTRPPVYSSQPHFLGADPQLREDVDGLPEPDPDTASTKVFIEPRLGLVLEAYKRLQISFYVRPSKNMAQFENWTKPIFLPVVWFEEKAVADATSLDILYNGLYVKPVIGHLALLITFCVAMTSTVLLLPFFVVIVCTMRKKRSRQNKTSKLGVILDTRYSKVVGETA